MLHEPQPFSAVSATFCDMYSISKEELMQTFDYFPDVQNYLTEWANEIKRAVVRRHGIAVEEDDDSIVAGDPIGAPPTPGASPRAASTTTGGARAAAAARACAAASRS